MDKALRLKGLFLFVLAIIGTSPMPSYAQSTTLISIAYNLGAFE